MNPIYSTAISARDVAAGLFAIYTRQVSEEYLKVRLRLGGSDAGTVSIRIAEPFEQYEYVDKCETIRCETESGKRADVWLPDPSEREENIITARVTLESEVLS